MSEEKPTTEELKRILEKTAQESGLKITGEIAVLKTDEQRESEQQIQEWKEEKTNFHFVKEFTTAHELLNCLFSTTQYHGFLMLGEGGLGKTILTLSSVKKYFKTNEWEYGNGYITPLALYEHLYLNRNKKVIILDDVEGIFNNKLSLSILKGVLWESDGKRICQYSSKSEKATMPQKFVMNAKIIILCNHIPRENDLSTRATLSRVISYKMNLTFQEKMVICKRFVSEEKIDEKVKEKVNFILDSKVNEATKDFNFRTLRKLIAFVQYDSEKAENLFEATTETDEDKEAYLKTIKHSDIVNLQIQHFLELTGKGRATFFRIKRSIKVSQVSHIVKDKIHSVERGLC
jgi:hypothetical protein